MSPSLNIREFRKFVGGFAWPTIALAIATWGVLIAAAYLLQVEKITPAVMVLIATACNYLSFTVFHEAAHENSGICTKVFGWIGCAMFMAPFTATKRIHLTHHQYTNDPEQDPDHWVAGHNPILVLLRCLTIYPRYLYTYLFNLKGPSRETRTNLFVLSIYWILGLAACFTAYAKIAIYGFMIPTFLGTGLTAALFDWIPHHPHKDQTPLGNTRNIPSKILNILMLGQNVHGVHHLNPRIPFYRYQRAYFAALRSADQQRSQSPKPQGSLDHDLATGLTL